MDYVKRILLPEEKVLYDGHVHPRVLLPGVLWLGIAVLMIVGVGNTGGGHSWLISMMASLAKSFSWAEGLHNMFNKWQLASPDVALEYKVLILPIAFWGFYKFTKALIIMQTTELVVTTHRIIAKMGVFEVLTLEMDKRRVAGVIVDQSFFGRIMGYGNIYIQGFTTSIGGLPVMVNPHLVERFVM